MVAVLASCAVSGDAQPASPPGTGAATANPQPTLAPGTIATLSSIEVGGTRRFYLVVAPMRQRVDLPLLVVLHGRSITVQDEAIRTGFLPLAQSGAAVLVYPVGVEQSWNAGQGCCGGAAAIGVDDPAFIHDLATDASRQLRIDPSRTYLVGYSNGGKLAFQLVCDYPSAFTAFATYGAVPLASCASRMAPPLSALISGGTADPELDAPDAPPPAAHAVAETAAIWRTRNGCAPSATVRHVSMVTVTSWTNCRAGTAVESVLYSGLTHYWPTATPGPVTFSTTVGAQAAAATLMWDFLSRHRRG